MAMSLQNEIYRNCIVNKLVKIQGVAISQINSLRELNSTPYGLEIVNILAQDYIPI
jgi:hypothetical protein